MDRRDWQAFTMKVLAVADSPAKALIEHIDVDRWRRLGIELLVSCGDLPSDYLGYLSDLLQVPLYYVHGNHDVWPNPPGGDDIDGKLFVYDGVRFLGIGGSPWYNGGPYQRTERSAKLRLLQAAPRVMLAGGVDVVVAHASPQFCPFAYKLCGKPIGTGRDCPYIKSDPVRICQDSSDDAHRGFVAYRDLISKYKPRLFLHGHRHRTYGLGKQELQIENTRVIDVFGYVVLDV